MFRGEADMNILVTHVSYHSSVGVVKLLRTIQRWPIHIVGSSSYPKGLSSGSLLVDSFFRSPPPESREDYLVFLIRLVEQKNIDFIISSDEDELLLMCENHSFFEGKVVLPPQEEIHLFRKKREASLAVERIGIPIPNLLQVNDLNALPGDQKVILRENTSCCSYGIYTTACSNLSDISRHMNNLTFIQKYIAGQEYTVDVLCDYAGVPKVIIPRARLAIRNGITYKCKIEYCPELINLCRKIYRHHNFPGFSNVQFIVQNETGIPYFIELNPRLGGTTIASSLASINLVELMLSHFLNKEHMDNFSRYMDQVKWGAVVARYYEETIYLGGEE